MIAAGLLANAGTLLQASESGSWRLLVRAEQYRAAGPAHDGPACVRYSSASSRRRRGDGGGGGADRVEVGGVLLVAADVAAEGAVDQLEGELLGAASVSQTMKVGEKRRRSQIASWSLPAKISYLLVERLALQLDPLFGAAEDVLELLQGAEAELALAVELGDEGRRTRGPRPGRACSGSSWSARLPLLSVRLFLVGEEGEGALAARRRAAAQGALGVAVVALAQQRRQRRQRALAAELSACAAAA